MRSAQHGSHSRHLSTLVAASFLLISLAACSGTSRQHNLELEDSVLKAISAMKDAGIEKAPSRSLTNGDFQRLCVQHPYMNKDVFEREANIIASDFEFALDDRHIWWFVRHNGTANWIIVPRVKIADLDRRFRKTCVSIATSTFLIARDQYGFTYIFEE